MSELPNWVYDLVAEIEEWEDGHPKEWECHGAWLYMIPQEVRDHAQAIADYKRREARQVRAAAPEPEP